MNKSFLFWMIAMLMLSVGMVGCSSSDDENIDETVNVSRGSNVMTMEEYKNIIIGEWQLFNCSGGYITINEDVEPGEVTLTFTKDGVVMINNIDDKKYHFPYSTGSYEYSFKEIVIPNKSKESRTVLVIDSNFLISDYDFYYNDDILILSPHGVACFYEYRLKKVE